jgi:succinate dehydrogenase / fumarate reductase iron-sulfur subunit
MDEVRLKIKRRDAPNELPYWEEFVVPYQPRMNVIMALQAIQDNPVTAEGIATTPVVWECSCLEEVCGSCTMIVNGRVRQACSALIDNLDQPIVLEPMTKFPVIRDLRVDRMKMFDALKRISAWVTVDGYHDLGPGPRMSGDKQQKAYHFSRCMVCGCCCEACPQYNNRSPFMGAFVIGQAFLFNMHPIGEMEKGKRLEALMGEGGLGDCSNAQNCESVCPKNIPLTEAIALLGWDTTVHTIKKLLR